MAARDNLRDDQFTTLLHISQSDAPPHLVNPVPPNPNMPRSALDDARARNKLLFTADDTLTLTDSQWMKRPFVHSYKVPKSLIMPVIHGDDTAPRGYRHHLGALPEGAPGLGPGGMRQLWEEHPLVPRDVVRSNLVMPFRNRFEGSWGNLSYAMPKKLARSGDIEYLGGKKREEVLPPIITDRGKTVANIVNGRLVDPETGEEL